MKKKKIMIILIVLMAIICLTEKTYAKTFDTTEKYRIYKCDSGNDYENCAFTSWTNNGTATSNTPSSKVIRGFSMNFAQNETLNGGGHYRVYIAYKTTPRDSGSQILHSYSCFGVNSNSESGGDEANIQSCDLTSTIPTSDGIVYIFDLVPSVNIKSIKINVYLNTGIPYTSVTGLAKSNLSNDTSTSDAINNQTDDLINNQNNNTQTIINNQNENTQIINNSINEQLGNKCENLFGEYKIINGWIDGTTWSVYSNGNNRVAIIPIKPNTTYTISREKLTNIFRVASYSNNTLPTATTTETYYTIQQVQTNNNGTFITYTTDSNAKWLLIHYGHIINDTNTNEQLNSIQVIEGNKSKPYCKYGSYSSKLDETNNILNQDHTYNNNPSQSTTTEQNTMNNFEQQEDALRNSLNLNIEDAEITINPMASNFIWDVVNRLRGMSGKIVLLFTSILSLGIMKMILGR